MLELRYHPHSLVHSSFHHTFSPNYPSSPVHPHTPSSLHYSSYTMSLHKTHSDTLHSQHPSSPLLPIRNDSASTDIPPSKAFHSNDPPSFPLSQRTEYLIRTNSTGNTFVIPYVETVMFFQNEKVQPSSLPNTFQIVVVHQ